MSRFQELSGNVVKTLDKLVKNKNLCKLLEYNSYDPLSKPDVENSTELLFSKIYPLPFTPPADITKPETSVINVLFNDFKLGVKNTGFTNSKLTFIILCHKNIWRIQDMLRPYAIMHEIDSIFGTQTEIGVGGTDFSSGTLTWANDLYSGYTITYKNYEFNK